MTFLSQNNRLVSQANRLALLLLIGVALLVIVAATLYLRARTTLPPGLDAEPARSTATESFDHSDYDRLLARYVSNERVNYRAWKASSSDLAALDAYLRRIGDANLARLGREERLAFFINAYNAITIRSILDAYPVASIRDIAGVWLVRTWRVAGGEITLDQIEHKILRKVFHESRIHFAIVCASKGCPPIQPHAFTGSEIESQLEAVTRSFMNDPSRTHLDAEKRRLVLTPILKWFSEDFIAAAGSVPDFVLKYRQDVTGEGHQDWSVEYTDYNWTLNE